MFIVLGVPVPDAMQSVRANERGVLAVERVNQ